MSGIIELTHKEFIERGEKLFGEDPIKWKFKCPACGNVQIAEQFREFKDKGATPNDVYQECIGRYTGGEWLGEDKKKSTSPCNYASYGLFSLGSLKVYHEDGTSSRVFNFANTKDKIGDPTPKVIKKKLKIEREKV